MIVFGSLSWLALAGVLGVELKAPTSLDITRIALTIAGGIGATVALVVAYRRQRDLEANRFTERFGAAAAQLGDIDPAVRLAGVYAMATVADDTSNLPWRKQCVDVLCAYLRTPFDPTISSPNLVERTLTRTGPGNYPIETAELHRFRYHDTEVRKTVVRVIADHLHRDAKPSWSSVALDLTGATLPYADFSNCVFGADAVFTRVTFFGSARFDGAHFTQRSFFDFAEFKGHATFGQIFSTDGPLTYFDGSAFFHGAKFHGQVQWARVRFRGHTQFSGMLLVDSGSRCEFHASVTFIDVEFSDQAQFHGVRFGSDLAMSDTTFHKSAQFTPTQGPFSHPVSFERDVELYDVKFSSLTSFSKAVFTGDAYLGDVEYRGRVNFKEAHFHGNTSFENAQFHRTADFRGCNFVGSTTFRSPLKWGNVITDWDDDINRKPDTVSPAYWPPPVASIN
ncbi:pentapeptide repeat-containing protein [Rhodococcus qingshengii]|uniref:pentapeptide repeat-containing protein n=1 Tax=Rhodococcus qingshengii TaxID=334542 RepID=UPI0022B33D3C|nr:pentapeptide repeat-containing protein [Rhodococcus qingshengii]MCZ4615191.1 pentapeptide repeat-containing protein [Rhodococcus qingshengii]